MCVYRVQSYVKSKTRPQNESHCTRTPWTIYYIRIILCIMICQLFHFSVCTIPNIYIIHNFNNIMINPNSWRLWPTSWKWSTGQRGKLLSSFAYNIILNVSWQWYFRSIAKLSRSGTLAVMQQCRYTRRWQDPICSM